MEVGTICIKVIILTESKISKLHCKKGYRFSVPSRDVTNQTLSPFNLFYLLSPEELYAINRLFSNFGELFAVIFDRHCRNMDRFAYGLKAMSHERISLFLKNSSEEQRGGWDVIRGAAQQTSHGQETRKRPFTQSDHLRNHLWSVPADPTPPCRTWAIFWEKRSPVPNSTFPSQTPSRACFVKLLRSLGIDSRPDRQIGTNFEVHQKHIEVHF